MAHLQKERFPAAAFYEDMSKSFYSLMKTMEIGKDNQSVDAFKPLTDDDCKTTATDDVVKFLNKMKSSGYNPTKLGSPMTDEELAKFHGIDS